MVTTRTFIKGFPVSLDMFESKPPDFPKAALTSNDNGHYAYPSKPAHAVQGLNTCGQKREDCSHGYEDGGASPMLGDRVEADGRSQHQGAPGEDEH